MTIVDRIKKLASARSLNIKRIEESTGLGNGTIRRWDESPPSADKLLKIANLLNTTCEYLLTGKEPLLFQNSPQDAEWLSIIHRLPEKKQIDFKARMEGYLECYEESVAADEPLGKTGTDMGK